MLLCCPRRKKTFSYDKEATIAYILVFPQIVFFVRRKKPLISRTVSTFLEIFQLSLKQGHFFKKTNPFTPCFVLFCTVWF